MEEGQSESKGETSPFKLSSKPEHAKLARLVTLLSNMKKSPWLLSRCKESPSHIQALINLLQPNDKITVAVKLESPSSIANISRFLVVVSTSEACQESAILGIDIDGENVTIGLLIPICDDMDIQMDGDGGFIILTSDTKHSFRPVSVQAMWSALQSLVKAVYYARYHHQTLQRMSHKWTTCYYISSSQECIFEWNRIIDNDSQSPGTELTGDLKLMLTVKRKLRDIMTNEKDIDLESVTSRYVMEKLEAALNVSLVPYKRFINEEMVIVMRQMDSPSQILDYLYLGSEWNASNLEELQQNRIGYILNVTREIDNFFPGMFKYCNVRVDDTEDTQLMRHWNSTYKFIAEAKKSNSRILVHCKMGVSRSASTVIAFVMKECGKPFLEAYQHVRQKRSCVKPNAGFMEQLNLYEGILGASKQRHNRIFRSRSAETLDNKMTAEDDKEGFDDKTIRDNDEVDSVGAIKDELDISRQESVDIADVSSSETNIKGRPATFSIDSVDAFSPSAITGFREDGVPVALVEYVEGDDEVLCDPSHAGTAQEGADQLVPLAVLSDPGLPISSMLRKLSCKAEDIESDAAIQPGESSHAARKPDRAISIAKVKVQRRSQSWPPKRKELMRIVLKDELNILRPNASKHRQLRGVRSKTIAFEN